MKNIFLRHKVYKFLTVICKLTSSAFYWFPHDQPSSKECQQNTKFSFKKVPILSMLWNTSSFKVTCKDEALASQFTEMNKWHLDYFDLQGRASASFLLTPWENYHISCLLNNLLDFFFFSTSDSAFLKCVFDKSTGLKLRLPRIQIPLWYLNCVTLSKLPKTRSQFPYP